MYVYLYMYNMIHCNRSYGCITAHDAMLYPAGYGPPPGPWGPRGPPPPGYTMIYSTIL